MDCLEFVINAMQGLGLADKEVPIGLEVVVKMLNNF